MRVVTAVVAALAIAMPFQWLGAQPTEPAPPIDPSSYKMTFNEEFDSLDVSAWGPGTRWIAHTPWGGDFGGAKFADPAPGFPFATEDGLLRIEARKLEHGKWFSGLLSSVDEDGNGFAQKYGYFEIRAKLPEGPGLWPAFWLIGLERMSPDSEVTAEIDVFEHHGDHPERFTSTVHEWDRTDSGNHKNEYDRIYVEPGILSDQFNTYGVAIDAEWTRFFFNRREVWRTPTLPSHRQPMFVLLNLGLAEERISENTPTSSYMWVDYVRVWRTDD